MARTGSAKRLLAIRVLGGIGLVLSGYALYVEWRIHLDPDYVALCDIGPSARCSRVLTSESSRLLWVPNALIGFLFYLCAIASTFPILPNLPYRKHLVFAAATASLGVCFYLGYIMYLMRDFCLLCASTYVVNFLLWIVTLMQLRVRPTLTAAGSSDKKQT